MAKKSSGNLKVAVAYLRVSTNAERQALGVEAQRRAIASWAEKHGIQIAAWFTEEVSGGSSLDKRPILLEAMASVAEHGAGQLVVQRLDRFSRDPLTAALAECELRRYGAVIACADGTSGGTDPTSELIRGILYSVQKFERAMIAARIKAALSVKKSRGELTGKAPFGMRRAADGKTLEADPEEAHVVTQIRELRASGLTVRGVQAAAAEKGLVGRAGRPLTLAALHALL